MDRARNLIHIEVGTIFFPGEKTMQQTIGRLLIVAGAAALILGIILYFRDTAPLLKHIGRLPGDIHIKKENFSFYFPVATCVVLSIVISLILMIWNKIR